MFVKGVHNAMNKALDTVSVANAHAHLEGTVGGSLQ